MAGQLLDKIIIQSRQWIDPNQQPIPNLDYKFTYPKTVYDAIHRTMDDTSPSLTDELESIYRLIDGKQNVIEAGTPGNLMTWTGVKGNIGSLEITKAINPDISLRSHSKIPTERAIGDALNTKASYATLNDHMENTSIHTNDVERTRWNSMAPLSTLHAHMGNDTLHINNNERLRWNAKAEQEDIDNHIYNTNNPHNVTAAQVGSYTRKEIDTKFESLREAFFNYMNIEWDDRTNQAKLVGYHPSNWNPNYVLGFNEDLPDVPDLSLIYFAIKPATDYEVNETDDVIIYIKRPALVWQEVGFGSMNAGDMLIRFPDTCMFVWVQGRFLRLFADSEGQGGGDLDGNVWRPIYNNTTGELTWVLSDSETAPDPVIIKGEDGYTPVKGVDYVDGADGVGVAPGGATGDLLIKLSLDNFDTSWVSFQQLMNDFVTGGGTLPENVIVWDNIKDRPNIYDEPGNNTNGVMTQKSVTNLYQTVRNDLTILQQKIEGATGIDGIRQDLYDHMSDYNNPHRVTPAIIGAISLATFNDHAQNFNNPHHVTKNQIELGNVDNTSDRDKPISDAVEEAIREVNDKITEIQQGSIDIDYVADVTWTDGTATLTFTFQDGTTLDVNLPVDGVIESIKNMYFDNVTKEIVIVTPDGDENRINIGAIVMSGSIGTHINVKIEDNVIKADLIPSTITGIELVTSIALRGSPTTTTQPVGDRSTRVSTTEFVKSQVVDNLISYEVDRPLSANQGRILNSTKVSMEQVMELINQFEGIHVIDNLESTSAVAALSANMGRHLDLTKAPRVHTSPTGATFGRATISLFGHARASDIDPLMDGTVFKGTDDGLYARGDHRHPTDITRAPVNNPEFTGIIKVPTPPDDSNDDSAANTEWVRRNAVGVNKGFSDTAGSTAIKVVTLKSDFMADPVFLRQTGSTVSITFTNTDTSGATATQLDVQSSGPAPVTFGGLAVTDNMISGNHTHIFTFDGTSWKLLNPAGIHPLAAGDSSNRYTSSSWVRNYAYSKSEVYNKTETYNRTEIDNRINDVNSDITDIINSKAPNNHASSATTYGVGTGALYGHLKISDNYTSSAGNAAAGMAASSLAVYNTYNSLNTAKAPNSHAVNANTYGLGTASLFGHVKLSDATNSTSNATASIAGSAYAVKLAYDRGSQGITDAASANTNANGRAPTNHASTGTSYGVGTTSAFGHLKISDSFVSNAGGSASAVAASSEAVYNAYTNLNNNKVSKTGDTMSGNLTVYADISANRVWSAVWNDYAEFRQSFTVIQPGRIAVEDFENDDYIVMCNERLAPTSMIISDTYGFALGEQDIEGEYSLPIGVSGRVLAYTDEDRNSFKPGDVVCSGVNGTVSRMTREEIKEYPDRIIGIVSSIPKYKTWGADNINVDGRIWIKLR